MLHNITLEEVYFKLILLFFRRYPVNLNRKERLAASRGEGKESSPGR